MLEVKELCGQICLGKQGENLARMVCFNEPEQWKTTFGEGKCELLHQRSEDSAPYPVILDIENDKICWKITDADTAMIGEGKCELHYIVDNVVVKSKIWTTTVLPSLGEVSEEPPEPQKAWVGQVLNAAQMVESATTHQPTIGENKNWFIWDSKTQGYVDSGVLAEGKDGTQIDVGETDEGIVLTVTTKIEGVTTPGPPNAGTGSVVFEEQYFINHGKDYVLTDADKEEISDITSGKWETIVDEVLTEDVTEIEYLFGKNYKKIVVQLTGTNKAATVTQAAAMCVCLNGETCIYEGEVYPVDIIYTYPSTHSPFYKNATQTTITIDVDGICKATCYVNTDYLDGEWYAMPMATNASQYITHGIAPYKYINAIQLRNDENKYGFAAGLHISIKGVAL